jgi:hypothetical protein
VREAWYCARENTIFTNSFHSISALDSTPNDQFSGASENITGHLSVQVSDENCG